MRFPIRQRSLDSPFTTFLLAPGENRKRRSLCKDGGRFDVPGRQVYDKVSAPRNPKPRLEENLETRKGGAAGQQICIASLVCGFFTHNGR
jgi:hypothetical protein